MGTGIEGLYLFLAEFVSEWRRSLTLTLTLNLTPNRRTFFFSLQ